MSRGWEDTRSDQCGKFFLSELFSTKILICLVGKSIGVSTLNHIPSNFFLVVVGLAKKFFERLKSSFNGLSLASQTDD